MDQLNPTRQLIMTFLYWEHLSGLPRPSRCVPSSQPVSELNLFETSCQSKCSQLLGVDKIFVLSGSKITLLLHFLTLSVYDLLNLAAWGFVLIESLSHQKCASSTCSANPWTGFYMIGNSVIKELHHFINFVNDMNTEGCFDMSILNIGFWKYELKQYGNN